MLTSILYSVMHCKGVDRYVMRGHVAMFILN